MIGEIHSPNYIAGKIHYPVQKEGWNRNMLELQDLKMC